MEVEQVTAQAVATGADSLRVRAKANAQRVLRQREALEQRELTGSDSVFLYARDTTYAEMCVRGTDVEMIVDGTRMGARCERISGAKGVETEVVGERLMEPTLRGETALWPYADVVVTVSVVLLVLLGVISRVTGTFVADLMGFVNNSNGWRRLSKSSQHGVGAAFVMLDGVYVVSLTMLVVEWAIVARPFEISVWETWLVVLCSLVLFYVARFVVDRVVGYAFGVEGVMREMGVDRHASRAIIGMVLSPLVLAMPFVSGGAGEVIGELGIGVLVVVSVWRVVRSLQINSGSLGSIVYFILYLCVVEIAPLVCLWRLFGMIWG